MALAYNKYQCFSGDLHNKLHDLNGTGGSTADLLRLLLTNTAPNAATHAVLSDVTQIANGNGYTTDGESCQNTGSAASGTFTLVCQDITWTSNGSMAGFRYVPMYNATASGKNLIAWWDLGATLTMTGNGDTWKADFGANTFTHS